MCKSPTGVRNHGGSIGVRCEVAQQEARDDGFYMRRCVELARKAIGRTSPNPMVGCVIVKDDRVVGEGFHPKAGQPHAEVFALRDAGELAENATAYVSLEPCNHYGRTPPCTEALIKAKVKKVVVGMVDPNPIVASKGLDRLRDAGIDVITVNGHFLDQLGEGVAELGGYYSELLQEYDAIVLTSATVTENNSLPASQEAGANQPLWIIIASGGSPFHVPVNMESSGKLIFFADNKTTMELESAQTGIETVVLDQINLNAITKYCKSQGICSVLLDLRGNIGDFEKVFQDGIEQKLQKLVIEVLPVWDQDGGGNFPFALKSLSKRVEVMNLRAKISSQSQSVVLEGYL
ncbi:hypothetical protein ACLB2K_072537 [Fragaria x ananassa]